MKVSGIPFRSTNKFSSLILDYLDQKNSLKDFYRYSPSIEGILEAANARQFEPEQRGLLADRLLSQYDEGGIDLKKSKLTATNIELLREENSLTITTGHQLNLMGGPLYSLYKILSVIKLTRVLNEQQQDFNFIPVFWMATEDHDFEEVDHFYFKGEKYQWNRDSKGAVGRLDNEGLGSILDQLKSELANYSGNAEKVIQLFTNSYLKQDKYANSCRTLYHQLFGDEGLVIIDGDDPELKRSFIPEFRKELSQFSTESSVNHQSEALGKSYKIQVNPRKINLFYLNEGRERIEFDGKDYILVDSKKKILDQDLIAELEEHPERFSPNVLMRPMYQEKILPNVAYIGGGGEIAYWLQLKANFDEFKLDFPVLLLRNSIVYLKEKESAIVNELQLDWQQLFEREGDLVKSWVTDQSSEELLIKKEISDFHDLWEGLKKKSLKEDASLGPHVEAQEVRLQKWLEALKDKLIRSQRRKNEVQVNKIKSLLAEIAPNGSLQERRESMIELLLIKGDQLVPELLEKMEVPTKEFLILEV